MATKMITKGSVQFQGMTIELGKPVLVNGRKGVPFMAWQFPAGGSRGAKASTEIRVKWENTYMPSDFSDVFGKRAVIEVVV